MALLHFGRKSGKISHASYFFLDKSGTISHAFNMFLENIVKNSDAVEFFFLKKWKYLPFSKCYLLEKIQTSPCCV